MHFFVLNLSPKFLSIGLYLISFKRVKKFRHLCADFHLTYNFDQQYEEMDLEEMGCGFMDWIELAQDRDKLWALVNAVMNLPSSIKCGEFLDYLKS
jgi:hypothetical protein